MVYTYDSLSRLTNARYSTGENYVYTYDAAGNRLEEASHLQTTIYQYDTANRLTQVNNRAYTWDNNGNLTNTGVITNAYDAANRLISSVGADAALQVTYDGWGNRVRQTVGATTTNFALDSALALPEVIATNQGTRYLHLPGMTMAQNSANQRVYLLNDGLGSVRQVISGTEVVGWREYDPYGQPQATNSFRNTFNANLEGWNPLNAVISGSGTISLSNPPGLMRLSATGAGSGLTVERRLSGVPGSLTISAVMTAPTFTTSRFSVYYADRSTDYIYDYPSIQGSFNPTYTTPVTKTPVALFLHLSANTQFPAIQLDVNEVPVTPAGATEPVTMPPFAFTGEWWENDVQLLHLRARWYDPSSAIFLSKDPWPGDPLRPQSMNGFSYVEGNPVNRVDPSGLMGCIGGGNLAVVEYDNCLTGGSGGSQLYESPGAGTVIVALIALAVPAIAYAGREVGQVLPGFSNLPPGVYSQQSPFPAAEPQCLDWPAGVPPYSMPNTWTFPSFGPEMPLSSPFPANPGFELPNTWTAQEVPSWLESWYNQMQKAPRRRVEQELNSLRKTLAKHEEKYRQILESGGYSQEVERMRLQVEILEELLGQ